MSIDLEAEYDKIYRYCYFKVSRRETAEDLTQETFLRFLESGTYVNRGKAIRYLYTIARNLCVDEYRRRREDPLEDNIPDPDAGKRMLTRLSVRMALAELEETDRELLLLRYGNGEPLSVICGLYGVSRFAAYRRISKAVKILKSKLAEEDTT